MTRYFVQPAVHVGACLVVPIDRVDSDESRSGQARWYWATRRIHALLISDANGWRCLGPEGEELPLGALTFLGEAEGMTSEARVLMSAAGRQR